MAQKTDTALPPLAALPLTLPLVLVVVAAALFAFVRSLQKRPLPGIPYNKEAAGTIFGDITALLAYKKKYGSGRYWMLEQLRKHNSVLVQIFIDAFSSRPAVILGDYREYYDICLRRTKEFDRAQAVTNDFGPAVPDFQFVLKSHDHKFKASKELVKDLMTPAFLNGISAPAVYSRACQILDLWETKRQLAGGRPFGVRDDLLRGALDMIIAVAMPPGETQSSTAINLEILRRVLDSSPPPEVPYSDRDELYVFPAAEVPAENQAVMDVAESIGIVQNSPAAGIQYWFMRMLPWLRNATRRKEALIEKHLSAAARRLSEPGAELTCAMDRMVMREINAAKKAGRAPDLHSRRMYDEVAPDHLANLTHHQVFGYLVGGSDTTATTLAWFCKYIADNPRVQSKLRAALREAHVEAVAERRNPSVLEITKTTVPYLDAVVEETLRLAGTAPIVGRDAIVDTTILGYPIPKGTLVLFMTKGPGVALPPITGGLDESQRSASSRATKGEWNPHDVELYRPERWIVTNPETGEAEFNAAAGPMMAFGGGPRGCFGQRLANLELRIVVTMLLWTFEFLQVTDELNSYEGMDTITTVPKMANVKLQKAQW